MRTDSSASATRFLRSALSMPRYVSGSSTFSYTVRSPIRLNAWKMKPISRLRMRARSEKERSATCLLFNQYLPSLGVSSRPRMDSSVVLPQPEGPAIETYSPFLISRWMPDRAWVSTSSVKNTLVTPSRWIRDPLEPFISSDLLFSVQAKAFLIVPRRGVGKDNLIAGIQTADDLHRVDRALAELHRDPHRLRAVAGQLEDFHLAVRLAVGRASHVEDVRQPLDLDRAVDREVRP